MFKEKATSVVNDHCCEPKSLYLMTRKSQEFFAHQIQETEMGDSVRYSLTFRRSHWRYKNSLCIIGDSNTKYLNLGEGEMTFGFATPGSKKWAPHISDINPVDSCAYKNVVVLCGINSIRQVEVNSEKDVRRLYYEYKNKIEMIRYVNPKCNILVCPVLPTKHTDFNFKANIFNKLIFNDLLQSSCYAVPVLGFVELLDRDSGFLSGRLSYDGDALHLNPAGGRILALKIKRAMFLRKLSKGMHGSRSYANAVSGDAGSNMT